MTIIRNITVVAAAFLASFSFAGLANAQSVVLPVTPVVGGGPIFHHASTIGGSYMHGHADIIRAQGQYNLNTAIGMRHYEEARSRGYDNDIKATETYFAKRQINREARYIERGSRPTREDIERYSKMNAGDLAGLSAQEYEPTLGELYWPALLNSPAYAAERNEINALFANRTVSNTGEGTRNHLLVKSLTNELEGKLKDNIRRYSPSDYMAAKRFLKSVEREAASQLNISSVVSR